LEQRKYARRGFAFAARKNGPVIIRGNPDKSPVITRLFLTDPEEVMPPPKEEHALSAAEVDLFRRWIAEGAEYKPHWAFVAPQQAEAPTISDFRFQISDFRFQILEDGPWI